jgi:hypothetical protein
VFLNGEYWGHYVARELLNEHFVRDNYGADPDEVDIVKTHVGELLADAGTLDDFRALHRYLTTNDLSDEAAYARARAWLDVDNWMDYWAAEVFIANADWYSSDWLNNIQAFRDRAGPDRRWRFVLWDTSYSQALGGGGTAADYDSLAWALARPARPNVYTDMFNALLENEGFRRDFVNRFADRMNQDWTVDRLHGLIDANAAAMAGEVGPNHARWIGECGGHYCPPDPGGWAWEVRRLKEFWSERPEHQRRHLAEHFDLRREVEITLRVAPAGAGIIRISTLEPQGYPWTGTYFGGNGVPVAALAAPGFAFAGWSPNAAIADPTRASFTAEVGDRATTFTANFERRPARGRIGRPMSILAPGVLPEER